MKSRSWIVLAAVVVAVLGGAVWWWMSATVAEESSEAGPSTEQIIAAKRAKRAERGDDADRMVSASGRITRASDDTAVAGALVLLNAKGGPGMTAEPGKRARPLLVRTDEAGEFQFDAVRPGSYGLSATADGLLPGRLATVTVSGGADVAGLNVALQSGGHRVTGTVRDLTGGSVDGAVVSALRLDEGNVLAAFGRAPSASMADGEGAYEIWLPDGAYMLTTEHPDYVKEVSQLTVDGGDRHRDITLTPGAAIEGTVVTRSGATVAGAEVKWVGLESMMQQGGGNNAAMGMAALDLVRTDDAGRFRITGLAPGIRSLTAVAGGQATRQPVEVPLGVAEEVSGVELVLDEAFVISGFVVPEGAADEGLEGVMISAWSMQPPAAYTARMPSEADGYFEINGVQPGTYFISAVSDKALPSFMSKSVTVGDADVDDVLLELGVGVHLRGRVEPAVAASITVEVDMRSAGMLNMMRVVGNGFVRGRSEADGTFDLFPIAGGTKLSLVATADDGRKGRVELDVGNEDTSDIVIELTPHARLAGVVTDAGGDPVEGVDVQVMPTTAAGPGMSMSFDAAGGIPGGGETGTTDEAGRYAVLGLDAGTYKVRVNQSKGPALAWAEPASPDEPTAPIEVTLAEAEQHDEFDLKVEARDGVIRGTVLDADGAPVADAWVRASREQSTSEFYAQIADQFARFSGGPSKKAKTRKPKQKREPSSSEKAASRALSHRFAEPPVLTDASGAFVLEDLREGTYLVIADGPRGSGRGQATGVALGETLTIEVEPLGGLSGVVTADGSPLAEYSIALQGPDVRSRRIKDASGRFAIDRLDPGQYEVEVDAEGGSVVAEVEVLASETADLKLKLDPFATLTGKLVDGNGQGIGGVNLMVQGRSVNPASMMSMFSGGGPKTDDDGSFSVDRIRKGKGTIAFVDPDAEGFEQLASASFEVEAGEDMDLGTITGVRTGDVAAADRGDLGFSTRVATFDERPLPPDAEDDDAPSGDQDDTPRLWVLSVRLEGPAAEAGLEPGDEIISIRDVGVQGTGASSAARTLRASHVRAGEDVAVEIRRDGMSRRVTVRARAKAG